jgi:putative ABC transport system permease protein
LEARRRSTGLRQADLEAIRTKCPLLERVVGEVQLNPVKAAWDGEERTTQLLGVEPGYELVRGMHLARGRFVNASDLAQWRPVCVLGAEIAVNLFGEEEDPLGKEVVVRGVRLTVVGLLQPKGQVFGQSQDDALYAPLSTVFKRMIGTDEISRFLAQARDEKQTDAAMDQVWAVLTRRHDNRPDFGVQSQSNILSSLGTIMLGVAAVLTSIAGLALLVGGIGIMNIMLVSVTERTREIGVRKAVGARRHDILWQFLIEAMTLSGIGGLVGVLLGYGVSFIVAAIGGDRLPAAVPPWASALGFLFALVVGVAAGVYPAFRAARLDPIQALRYE